MPTYRESANIGRMLRNVRATVPGCSLLVVDDEGGDGTADIAEAMANSLGSITVLRRPGKGGLASAYRDGFRWALERNYDVIVGMDADLSHDATALPRLLDAITAGADVAVGSRYIAGGSTVDWPIGRRVLSRVGNWYAARCLDTEVRDLTSAFRAYRADVLRSVELSALRADGYGFLIELAYELGRKHAKFVEVPVCFVNRAGGKSKMSVAIALESLYVVTRLGMSRQEKS